MSRIMQKEIKSEMNDFFFAKDHLDFYHEYVNVEQKYLAGIKEVRTKLEILDDEFHHRFDHNPIHHMEWRLKSPHSVVEKMKRRNLPVEVSSIKGNIEDIAGIRVICHYIKDIYRMSDLLLRSLAPPTIIRMPAAIPVTRVIMPTARLQAPVLVIVL